MEPSQTETRLSVASTAINHSAHDLVTDKAAFALAEDERTGPKRTCDHVEADATLLNECCLPMNTLSVASRLP
jgi:hypothetical protein